MKREKLIIIFLVCFFISSVPINATSEEGKQAADYLYNLGLFNGTGRDQQGNPIYSLDKPSTRAEAVTMLVRLLGREEEAKANTWEMPFTDVPTWAKPYVGYAYINGLTNGVSEFEFGSSKLISVSQYLTLVLRALGYESGSDFVWENAWLFSDEIGMTDGRYNEKSKIFLREDMTIISKKSLEMNIKGSEEILLSQIEKDYDKANNVLSSEEISVECAPAVFHITTYSFNGRKSGSASGFFISSDGLAITNYHVVANNIAFEITTHDGKKYKDVDLLDIDEENDIALLKVKDTVSDYLEIGEIIDLKQGQKVYAFGSPLGLQNSMSEGIISNPNRGYNNVSYIQISVPIDHGSSGGALVNVRGQVIGVTSSGYNSFGDLNFAIPINKIKLLDQKSEPNHIHWRNEFYKNTNQIPDFGKFSGVQLVNIENYLLGTVYYYDIFDFYDYLDSEASDAYAQTLFLYSKALEDYGFNKDPNQNVEYYYNEDEGVIVKSDFDAGLIEVDIYRLPKTYSDFPNLIDFGWYANLDFVEDISKIGDSVIYEYLWLEDNEFDTKLLNYLSLLEFYGYEYIGGENGLFLYEGNGLSIVFIFDKTSFVIDVQKS